MAGSSSDAPSPPITAQKMMIQKANRAGKPIITATQKLDSMGKNGSPTRAECADVANAVLDGTDAVMLCSETATGDYPVKAVRMMSKICVEAESVVDYAAPLTAADTGSESDLFNESIRIEGEEGVSTLEAAACSAVQTANDVSASLIIVFCDIGTVPQLVAKYRPHAPIYVVTASEAVARQLHSLLYGCCHCSVPPVSLRNGSAEVFVRTCIDNAVRERYCQLGDRVVVLYCEGVELRSNEIQQRGVVMNVHVVHERVD